MKQRFHIECRHSAGNLHIQICGEFNGMCAWQLIKIIKQQNCGAGRIFVSTTAINRLLPDGVDLFKSIMTKRKLPTDWLYFKGKKGLKIAPDGSRVIIWQNMRRLTGIPSKCPKTFSRKIRVVK